MITYILRRCLYAIPILFGINVLVFILFFMVNTPEDMARAHLGVKHTPPEAIDRWMREHGLDVPMFYNQGWKKIDVIVGTESGALQTILLPQPGQYRMIYDSPVDELATERTFEQIDSTLELSISAETLREEARAVIEFKVDQASELKGTFRVKPAAPAHRLIFEVKTDLNLAESLTETIFYKRSLKMLAFDYGKTDRGEHIASEILTRLFPSLCITLPALLLGAFFNIIMAMLLAVYRGSYIDTWGTILCVFLMSISAMFYIIGGQWLFGAILKVVPISGFDIDGYSPRFMILPVAIIVMSGMGAMTRFYRTLFLEELNKLYVQTARAKGLNEKRVLFVHVLKNAMIPILTGLVVQLPLLFIGSLLIENFFSIPGMGAYTVEAIQAQDFATVQAMVSLGSFVFIIALLLTDISYTLVDPRVRLGD